MKVRYLLFSHILLSIFCFIYCEKEPTSPELEGKGKLIIHLTDAPANYDAVNITFSNISAHIDSEWINISSSPQEVNLLQWNDGKSIVIGEGNVKAGHYTQIRLIIDDANIVVDGVTHPLEVPSGAKTGLKFGPEFDILSGSTYELVIDFDAKRSIVTTGPPHNPKGYKLKPRIRVMPKAITGSITGSVDTLDLAHFPVAHAIFVSDTGDVTITSADVDTNTGMFMLSFLPENYYDVTVEDTLGHLQRITNIKVEPGVNKTIDEIDLF